ncbi:MAG: TetR/AcrR family transcriptional regulator [Brevundimonas sp.]|uniref:TetR/AcrR family transcriptional regulator n=1 Tax=Brevundimonas sp. TaxID=1871086 RepID=UPI00391DCE0B
MVQSIPVPAPRVGRKPKGEGHERRAEILEAAERIFVEHGYDGATIRKIADDVGLSSTALYMHFRDKSQILAEICRSAFEQLTILTAQIEADAAPVEVKMRRMMEAYARFGLENPNAYRLIYMTRPEEARSGAEDVARDLGAGLFQSFGKMIGQAHAAGRLRHDPAVTGQILWAGAHGVVSLMITKPYFDWAAPDALVGAMLDALFEGVLKP